eukprot:COSAG05_NODE_1303_length_5240_cov_2.158335_4_plen_70_part_00
MFVGGLLAEHHRRTRDGHVAKPGRGTLAPRRRFMRLQIQPDAPVPAVLGGRWEATSCKRMRRGVGVQNT